MNVPIHAASFIPLALSSFSIFSLYLLGREIKSKTVTEHLTEDIPKRIETLNSEFYFNLKNRFPNLTKTDVQLCSLIRLNVENSDIAILQNVSKKSVYTSRFRLRKRLELDENLNLDDFVKNI